MPSAPRIANRPRPLIGRDQAVRFVSLCSGIEAASVAWEPLGWTPVAFSEIDPFCSTILRHRFPAVPNLGDMTCITPAALRGLGGCHVLIAGTPCQAFSTAGKRKGLRDDRGNITLSFARIVSELDPPVTLWENVPGVLSDSTNAFGCLLAALIGQRAPLRARHRTWSRAGVALGSAAMVAWRVLDAQHFGVPQQRHRVFVVRCPRNGADPREILLERAGVRWHHPPSGKAGTHVAYSLDRGAGGISAKEQQRTMIVCRTVSAKWSRGSGGPSGDECANLVTRTLTRPGSSDGGGKGVPMVVMAPSDGIDQAGSHVGVDLYNGAFTGDRSPALTSHEIGVCDASLRVRRLTPRECERLQGFPDDWTAPTGREPDTRRYEALGNSMAVPVIRWIGRRIEAGLRGEAA